MLTNIDFALLNAVQGLRSGALDSIMIIITYIGSSAALGILAALILGIRRSTRRFGLVIAIAMIFGLIAGPLILKNIVLRPRPFAAAGALLTASQLPISVPMGEFSFPSGHSVNAFAAAAGIYFYSKRLGAAAYVFAAAVGFSRVYLYVHFPSDVIAGAAVGIICAFAAKYAVNKLPSMHYLP